MNPVLSTTDNLVRRDEFDTQAVELIKHVERVNKQFTAFAVLYSTANA